MPDLNPRLERPSFDASYGVTGVAEGAVWGTAAKKLHLSRNYWIGTTRASGAPHAKPVWGVWLDGTLWFGTSVNSVTGRNLARDPRVSVHIESGDDVVIIEGTVQTLTPGEVPPSAAQAFEEKYGLPMADTDADAVWYALVPSVALTWLEAEFVDTAARWVFD